MPPTSEGASDVPIIHGRYEADQKSCSSIQQFRTRQMGNLLLVIRASDTVQPIFYILEA